jgi:hypothetical protein
MGQFFFTDRYKTEAQVEMTKILYAWIYADKIHYKDGAGSLMNICG